MPPPGGLRSLDRFCRRRVLAGSSIRRVDRRKPFYPMQLDRGPAATDVESPPPCSGGSSHRPLFAQAQPWGREDDRRGSPGLKPLTRVERRRARKRCSSQGRGWAAKNPPIRPVAEVCCAGVSAAPPGLTLPGHACPSPQAAQASPRGSPRSLVVATSRSCHTEPTLARPGLGSEPHLRSRPASAQRKPDATDGRTSPSGKTNHAGSPAELVRGPRVFGLAGRLRLNRPVVQSSSPI